MVNNRPAVSARPWRALILRILMKAILLVFFLIHVGLFAALYYYTGPIVTLIIAALFGMDRLEKRYKAWKFQWDMLLGMEARKANTSTRSYIKVKR